MKAPAAAGRLDAYLQGMALNNRTQFSHRDESNTDDVNDKSEAKELDGRKKRGPEPELSGRDMWALRAALRQSWLNFPGED